MLRGLSDPNNVSVQYRDSSNLDARIQLHKRFSTNPQKWPRWYFDQLDVPADARLLELGCGAGTLWTENADRIPPGWDITLTDISPGMLEAAQRNLAPLGRPFTFREVDAQSLPYPDQSFDAVLANHMLYHVPDRAKAFSEVRRVLKPGGRFYAATNGQKHMHELRELVHGPEEAAALDTRMSFYLETGLEQLSPWFSNVEMRTFPDSLEVTEKEALMAYLGSTEGMGELDADMWERAERRIDEELARNGMVRIRKIAGLFRCEL